MTEIKEEEIESPWSDQGNPTIEMDIDPIALSSIDEQAFEVWKNPSDPTYDNYEEETSLPNFPKSQNHKFLKIGIDQQSIISISSNYSIISDFRDPGESPEVCESPIAINPQGDLRKGDSSMEEEPSNLLLARIKAEKEKEVTTNVPPNGSSLNLFSMFQSLKDNYLGNGVAVEEEVDWDFWGKVVSDFDKVAFKHSRTLTKKVQLGIPAALRGMVWQLLCKGKNVELEQVYTTLLSRSTTHEKLIQRDLNRTFPELEYFKGADGQGQEALFNILKAYSLYDLEVGYCQGISFVVGALLLNMPEEEAFCVLVQLMKQYHFRELYKPDMAGLLLRLYQFDIILKEQLPQIDAHLLSEGIQSDMFMTLFAYRFPLDIVFRVMDLIFAEGIESMFKIAIALLKKNKDHILLLDFESLLEYLKNGLFDVYVSSPTSKVSPQSLVFDAAQVRLQKARLDKLQCEFELKMKSDNDPEKLEAQQLRTQNRHMLENFKKMEEAYELLNREHIALANDHLEQKGVLEKQADRIEELEEQIGGLRGILVDEKRNAEFVVKDEMDQLMAKNFNLTRMNAELKDEVEDGEEKVVRMKKLWKDSENEKDNLLKKWSDLKKVLEQQQ